MGLSPFGGVAGNQPAPPTINGRNPYSSPVLGSPGYGGGVGGGYAAPPTTSAPSMPSMPQPAPATTTAAPAPVLQNTTKTDPNLQAQLDAYKKQLAYNQGQQAKPDQNLQWQIDQYKSRLSNDPTQAAINQSTEAIQDMSAGADTQADEMAARRGIGGSGLDARSHAAISDAAQRQQAKSASDITLGRQAQLDALTLGGQGIMSAQGQYGLAQQGLNNNYVLGGANLAGAQGQLALGQQGLGLQQWQAQNQAQLQQQQLAQQQYQQQLSAWMAMMNQVGY